jgi:hypothetical protein
MPDYNFMQQTPQYPSRQWGVGYWGATAMQPAASRTPQYNPNANPLYNTGNLFAANGAPNFDPQLPPAPTYTPGVPHNLSPPANADLYDQLMRLMLTGGFLDTKNWMSDDWRGNVGKSLSENVLFPMLQYLQNQHQWLSEFNESVRREDEAAEWQRYADTFGMELSKAQQALNEWSAEEAAKQWQKQHAFEKKRWAEEQQVAAAQRASEELQSRYAAFGRAQAPQVQWTRTW